LGIEAILASEGATMECHERGHALTVDREAVAVDANEWGGGFTFYWHFIWHCLIS